MSQPGLTVKRPRAPLRKGSLAGSLLIHLICWGLAATVLVQQAVTGDWRGADAPSGTVSKLSIHEGVSPPAELFEVRIHSLEPPLPVPAPELLPIEEPLALLLQADIAIEVPDPLFTAAPLTEPEHPSDLAPTRSDWLRRLAATAIAAPRQTSQDTQPATPDAPVKKAANASETTPLSAAGGYVEPSHGDNKNLPPKYPGHAHRFGLHGTVIVVLTIDAGGNVTAAHIEQSSGYSELDDAALQQLGTWHFSPAMRNGIAVAGTFRQPIVFKMAAGHLP